MNEVYLILGGNISDRMEYLKRAVLELENLGIHIEKKSSVYETEAWGEGSNGSYLNMVIKVLTDLSAKDLLGMVLNVEQKLGRKRQRLNKNADRTIDIDILFYNRAVIQTKELIIPHPRLTLRKFVLEPLLEVAKDFIHPLLNKTIAELYLECSDLSHVKKYV